MPQEVIFTALEPGGELGGGPYGLWITDGTVAGTHQLTPITGASGPNGSSPYGFDPLWLTAFDHEVIFSGVDAAGDQGVWVTNGTAAGTFELPGTQNDQDATKVTSWGGFEGFYPAQFQVAGNQVFFASVGSDDLANLWVTNGTSAGTHELTGVVNANTTAGTGLQPHDFAVLGSQLIFGGLDAAGNNDLWVSGGTLATTGQLTGQTNGVNTNLNPVYMATIGSRVWFTSKTDGSLWVTDGTAAGTQEVAGTAGLHALFFTPLGNGDVLFAGGASDTLYVIDGPTGTPQQLFDSTAGATNPTGLGSEARINLLHGASQPFVTLGGKVLFEAFDSQTNLDQLWVTNGTLSGTHELTVSGSNTFFGLQPHDFVVLGDEVLFRGTGTNNLSGIWVTDGTGAGTHELAGVSGDESDPFFSSGTLGQMLAFDLNPTGPPAHDFNNDGKSDFLIENTNGAVFSGEASGSSSLFTAATALGAEWTLHGTGDLLGDGSSDFLMRNTSGAVVAAEVNSSSVAFTQVASLGAEWAFKGIGDFNADGHDQFLIENTAGAVVVGDYFAGQIHYATVAGLGPEWKFGGVGDFNGDGVSEFLIENGAGAVDVGAISNGVASFTQVSGLGPEWSFVGVGDFLGNDKSDFLIENTAGAVFAGEVTGSQTAYTQVTALGPEWKFVGAGDYLGEGHDQFLIENTSGAVVIGDWTGGAVHYTQVASLGPEWAFH